METLLHQIEKINFPRTGDNLIEGLDTAFKIISAELSQDQIISLKDDFDFYKSKGRWWVHNTFAGGIIFLREPEVIEEIRIEFKTEENIALASVEYESENRNSRNVKYKPLAGKIESLDWNMLGVFPNFNKYKRSVKISLMMIIGKHVKSTCEHLHFNS